MAISDLTKLLRMVLLFSLATTYFPLASVAERFITLEDIKADLQTRDVDRILRTLNGVKQMQYQGQVLPFLLELWNNHREQHPDLPWNTINSDIVRIEVANVLLQGQRNDRIKIHTDSVYEYLAGLTDSADIQVAQSAILTVSLIDEAKSVERIKASAKRQNQWTFRSAVVALNSMCHPSAEKALDELENDINDKPELKEEIRKERRKMTDYKARTGLCKRKIRGDNHDHEKQTKNKVLLVIKKRMDK